MRDETGGAGERSATMRVGVVLERRRIDHPWQKWRWRAVSVIAHAPPIRQPRLLLSDGTADMALWHTVTLPLLVHRTDTEAYKYNLSTAQPQVYVVLRPGNDEAFPLWPALVTVSPSEAQAYSETSEDRVEPVPMPEPIIAWLKAFVDRHHVDRPIVKRRRKGLDRGPGEESEFEIVEGGSSDAGRVGE